MLDHLDAKAYWTSTGRVSYSGFVPEKRRSGSTRNRASNAPSSIAVAPEEVLFRRKGAPERYEENDFYWTDRRLPPERKLPDSDLLKAIHAYAADFYQRTIDDRGQAAEGCMDETALLALGVLMEEAAAHSLGRTGDMALVEGEASEASALGRAYDGGNSGRGTGRAGTSATSPPRAASRTSKRRKVKEDDGA